MAVVQFSLQAAAQAVAAVDGGLLLQQPLGLPEQVLAAGILGSLGQRLSGGKPGQQALIKQGLHTLLHQRLVLGEEADGTCGSPSGAALEMDRALAALYDADGPGGLGKRTAGKGRGAPTVVAKGSDEVAAKIRELARENKVALLEARFALGVRFLAFQRQRPRLPASQYFAEPLISDRGEYQP